jgi:D-alanyl-D-alanine carboxypeptidase/D-alanyl-D-alanine-endopeptidase (penicillin-binding protein 4)
MLRISARRAALLSVGVSLLAVGVLLATATAGAAAPTKRAPHATTVALSALDRSLNAGMRAAGRFSGAYAVDLTTGQVVYSKNPRIGRLPASVEKLYTTSTALAEFGPTGTLSTSVLGLGQMSDGTFKGTLYLHGGGDPTFGSAAFDHASYGTGATVQQLVANLITATGIKRLDGPVVADQSMFDSLRGTPATGYGPSTEVEGELGALTFNRGWANSTGTALVANPALTAGQQFVAALKAARVKVGVHPRVRTGVAPPSSQPLAAVRSPTIAALVALTNTPSDNYFAETLLKDLGARFGTGGTTAAGAAVVRATIAKNFGLHPRLNDGSGLSRFDRTTPFDVVSLLRKQATDPPFVNSLAIAGRTGTLVDEMRRTYAQGRCRGKTGTLRDVSNVVGYCHARDGHTIAYALMMNGIVPSYAHPIQDRMVVALAKYDG